jgi:hypothetical protein
VFEELAIGFERETRFTLRDNALRPAWWRGLWRPACGRLVPEAAVLEDLSDHFFLASLDEGDDFHGSAAFWAAERVGLVDALNEDGPAAAVELGRLDNRRGLVGR